jgi:VWFA-related protein
MATSSRRLLHGCLVGAVIGVFLIPTVAATSQAGRRTVYVTALDRNNQPMLGLTAADFRVKEDGRVREVIRAEPGGEPMQISLLLDDGGPSLGAIRQAAAEFVERLQGKATFSLITTGGRAQTRVNFTEDPRVLYGALQNLFANSAPTTQFLDSLVEVARNFVRRKAPRPVIVAIVSEGEELSDVRADDVLRTIQQSRAVFYYIGLGLPVTSGTRPALQANRPADSTEHESIQRNIVIGAAPKNSGGRSEQVLQPAGLLRLMEQFAAELVAGQYAVTYSTDNDRGKLEVETPRQGVKLRAPARVGDR